jgi:O-antigen/teichoic acid export membrane protein
VVVTAALPNSPALAFAFAAGLVLTRAPLLLIAPVQAVLLPRFTAADARGDLASFRHELRRGLLAVAAVAGLGVAGWGLLGRPAMRIVYGAGADLLPTATLVLLAVGAGLLMAISLVQPALVALGSPTGMALGWVCGAAAFVVSFLLPLDPLDRAVVAQLFGPAVTLLVQARILRGRLR